MRDEIATPSGPAGAPPASIAAGEIEALYLEYRPLLMYVAAGKFRVPQPEAEGLIQEVFLSFIQSHARVQNVRAWLVAAICNASRHYWRVEKRSEQLPEDYDCSAPGSEGLAEEFALSITLRQAIGYLKPRCRETLQLHYFEGRTASDVANELDTTPRYAEKLIHNCLKQVREIYTTMMRARA